MPSNNHAGRGAMAFEATQRNIDLTEAILWTITLCAAGGGNQSTESACFQLHLMLLMTMGRCASFADDCNDLESKHIVLDAALPLDVLTGIASSSTLRSAALGSAARLSASVRRLRTTVWT